MTYQWLQLGDAVAQLAQRLYDPNNQFWPQPELVVYIQQALRQFNSLTNTWKADFTFNPLTVWNSMGTLSGTPRVRTVTDTACYTQMEMMLLEPPSGGAWTGTPQFDIPNLSGALQKRRDEILQVTNCNQQLKPNIPITLGIRRTVLPDNVIEVARVRYLAASLGGGAPTPAPVTLYRDDTVALEYYEPGFWQADPNVPQTFMLSSQPPLTWDVDVPPAQPGTYEAVTLQSGTPFAPPAATLLNIPDDFAWVAIWGALFDLLGRESEATDRPRAEYCMKRYLDGLTLMLKTPWILLAKVNQQAVNIESIANADRYMPEWDSSPSTIPCIVAGGIDFFAGPADTTSGTAISLGLTVVGNAPIPVQMTDFVQVSRPNWDTVLDLAQVWASFKMGGAEFQSVMEIETRAIQACAAENTRLKSTGAFSDILMQRGQAQERDQERYATAASKNANAA